MGLRGARRSVITARILALLVSLGVLVAGCGASTFTYVKNSKENLFFKVPAGWHKLDRTQVDAVTTAAGEALASSATVTWAAAFDGSKNPSATHIFTSTTADPVILAEVLDMTNAGQQKLSFNAMRDLFLPVTDTARAGLSSDSPLSHFKSLDDEVLTRAHGLRGVRTVYAYSLNGGPLQAFDQTVLTNSDSTKLYLLFVRCSADCYLSQQSQIRSVVNSFTVGG
jgi:hypothetical protein